ncbi:MAG: cyclic nucleotide-binding/CBS domain-containing protein [Candidatus Nanohaloarchaea archaeon]
MDEQVELKEIMTDGVIAVDQDASIVEAARKLREEDIRGLVVVDEGDAVGVLVARDIVYNVVASNRDPAETQVKDVMSTDLIVAEEDELLNDVAMAMAKNEISRVPVVRGDMLVGIVTQSDILRAWPGFAEIMEEEVEMEASAAPRKESKSGTCENCENYSEDLQEVDGLLLCPECR